MEVTGLRPTPRHRGLESIEKQEQPERADACLDRLCFAGLITELSVATSSAEGNTPYASDAGFVSSSDDEDCQTHEPTADAARPPGDGASAQEVPAMNFNDAVMLDTAHDAADLVEVKPSADANGSQIGVMIAGTDDPMIPEEEEVTTAGSRVPMNETMVSMPCDPEGTALESANNMGDSYSVTTVQVMQSLIDVVDTMDVITNEAEPLERIDADQELNPSASGSTHPSSQRVSAEDEPEAGIDEVLTEPTEKNDHVEAESGPAAETRQKTTKEQVELVSESDQPVKMVGGNQEWSRDPRNDSSPEDTVDLCGKHNDSLHHHLFFLCAVGIR